MKIDFGHLGSIELDRDSLVLGFIAGTGFGSVGVVLLLAIGGAL